MTHCYAKQLYENIEFLGGVHLALGPLGFTMLCDWCETLTENYICRKTLQTAAVG